jgi:hypothetical protein
VRVGPGNLRGAESQAARYRSTYASNGATQNRHIIRGFLERRKALEIPDLNIGSVCIT